MLIPIFRVLSVNFQTGLAEYEDILNEKMYVYMSHLKQ